MKIPIFFQMNLIAAALFATGSSAESIGDFAPMEIGAVWEYSYLGNYTGWPGNYAKSCSIKIELVSKEKTEADSQMILRIRENGSIKRFTNAMGERIDSTAIFSTESMDTAFIRGNVICQAAGYKCPIFPFCRSHTISLDSLARNISGNDSLYYTPNKSMFGAIFLQGAGLYSLTIPVQTPRGKRKDIIALVSYNNKPIPVALRSVSRTSSTYQTGASTGYAAKVFLSSPPVSDIEVFSLSGKKMGHTDIAAPCIGIGKKTSIGQRVK